MFEDLHDRAACLYLPAEPAFALSHSQYLECDHLQERIHQHSSAAASEGRCDADAEYCYVSMQPKSCSADCSKVLLLIRPKRD